MKQYFIHYLKGIAMGTADVIPGVSGGTIAFITGIYDRLIAAVGAVNLESLKLFFAGDFKTLAKRLDLKLLIPVLLGIASSVLTLGSVFKSLLEHYPVHTTGFFFGLIAASVFLVGKTIKSRNAGNFFLFIAGVIAAASIAFLTPGNENPAWWYLMLCGSLAICSMILPGISGSFVLLILGNYALVFGSLSSFDFSVIIPFACGALIGLLSFVRVLAWLFKNHNDLTLSALTGFILGSLTIIFPWKTPVTVEIKAGEKIKEKVIGYDYYVPDFTETSFFITLAFILLGIIAVAALEKMASRRESDA